LGEGLEQARLLFVAHADAVVLDGEDDPGAAVHFLATHAHLHLAALGELVGVGDEVEEDLPDLGEVADHVPQLAGAVHHHVVAVLLDEGLQAVDA